MQTLHEIWPAGAYCGPSVLAALTGCDAKRDIRGWVNAVRGRKPTQGVLGMPVKEMSAVLASRGYGFQRIEFPKGGRPRLADFAADAGDAFYIVNVTSHYVALLGGVVADNFVRFGRPVERHPHRRKLVCGAWRILS
jgi:hypothetical protein